MNVRTADFSFFKTKAYYISAILYVNGTFFCLLGLVTLLYYIENVLNSMESGSVRVPY